MFLLFLLKIPGVLLLFHLLQDLIQEIVGDNDFVLLVLLRLLDKQFLDPFEILNNILLGLVLFPELLNLFPPFFFLDFHFGHLILELVLELLVSLDFSLALTHLLGLLIQ